MGDHRLADVHELGGAFADDMDTEERAGLGVGWLR